MSHWSPGEGDALGAHPGRHRARRAHHGRRRCARIASRCWRARRSCRPSSPAGDRQEHGRDPRRRPRTRAIRAGSGRRSGSCQAATSTSAPCRWSTRTSSPASWCWCTISPSSSGARPRRASFLLLAFGLLALGASLITIVAARLSWRGFRKELLRFIQGESRRKEFLPIIRDVRELVERIAAEREIDGQAGAWSPQRLKQTLVRHFPGEKVIVLANREPYIHQRGRRRRDPGRAPGQRPGHRGRAGAARLLGRLGRARQRLGGSRHRWIGTTTCACRRARSPTRCGGCGSRPRRSAATTTASPTRGCGRCATWPTRGRIFRGDDWAAYEAVNRKFADAVCEEADARRSGRAGAGLPLRAGAAPHPRAAAPRHHHHLLAHPLAERRALRHLPVARRDPRGPARQQHRGLPHPAPLQQLPRLGRSLPRGAHRSRAERRWCSTASPTLVRPYPISIDWPNDWAASAPAGRGVPPAACCAELGLAKDALLGVGVDRLDYTKGIEERFLAVERLLERFPSLRRALHLRAARGAQPHAHRALPPARRRRSRRLAARINATLRSEATISPSFSCRAHHEPPAVFRYYRAADVCYVSAACTTA